MAAIFLKKKLKWIYVNVNARISIEMSLKFVPSGRINNIPSYMR